MKQNLTAQKSEIASNNASKILMENQYMHPFDFIKEEPQITGVSNRFVGSVNVTVGVGFGMDVLSLAGA